MNNFYKNEPALYECDFIQEGFEWRNVDDYESSTLSFIRKSDQNSEVILVTCNFTPVIRDGYKINVPRAGHWSECLNSDGEIYGGSGIGNAGGLESFSSKGKDYIEVKLPPLGVIFFKFQT